MMRMSEKGRDLLSQWEGFELRVYRDVAGLETIGVGHLLTADEKSSGVVIIRGAPVAYAGGLTKAQVLDLLGADLNTFEDAVSSSVTVGLRQNQFDALVSFSFNVGAGAFRKSTLLKVLNQGKYDEVPNQLRQWVRAGGKTVRGLVNRRENEIRLWNDAV